MQVKRIDEIWHIYYEKPPTYKKVESVTIPLERGDIWHSPDGSLWKWNNTYWELIKNE